MGSTVKKVMRPEVLLPLAVIGTGGAALGAFGPAAKAAMVGTGGIAPVAGLPAVGGGAATAAAGTKGTAGILGGLFGTGGKMSTAAKLGLGAGAVGGLSSLFGKDKEPAKRTGPTQQEVYDLGRLMNQKMGGAMTNAELNTAFAPLLSQYGGDKAVMLDPNEEARKRREMYRGLNYSGLTRGLADGGSIEPIDEEENRQIIMDALLGETMPGMNEDAIAEQMFDMQRRERLNPTGRAMGGRIGMDEGGVLNPEKLKDEFLNLSRSAQLGLMDAATNFQASDAVIDPFLKLMGMKKGGRVTMGLGGLLGRAFREGIEAAMKNPTLGKVFGRTGGDLNIGDVVKMEKKTPFIPKRDRRISNIGVFGKKKQRDIDKFQREIIDQMMEMDSIEGLAMGGSVPQTERMPNGMQIDGRGGGFIPMGARERKDDVPAMLAKNEFVMTADAVRGMGNGDVNQGAQKMYDLMNNLESKV